MLRKLVTSEILRILPALPRARFAPAGLSRNAITRRTTGVSACMCGSVVMGLAGCGSANPNTGMPQPRRDRRSG